MTLLTYYLLAAGFGLIQCLSAIARNAAVNKIATILNFGGIVLIAILGIMYFDILDMLGGVLTVFLVGMIFSYIILKLNGKGSKK